MSTPTEIVNALRRGVPPEYDLGLFSVGREGTTAEFIADLDAVKAGSSMVRYLDADFGQGKTHLLKSLREEGFRSDFVVAIVELSTGACPLFSLVEVYRQIITGLRTSESPREPALERVLDRWLELQEDATPAKRVETLRKLPVMLQAALLAFLQATTGPTASLQNREMVIRYLTGEKFGRTERTRLELFENIVEGTTLMILESVAGFVRDLGYGGLCILFDEAEGIVSFSRSSQQEAALNNLVRLLRMTTRAEGCYFMYAATPSFFDAFGDRPSLQPPNSDGTVMKLERLSVPAIHELIHRISSLYAAAYSIDVPPELIATIRKATNEEYGRVSDLTRMTVAALDEYRNGGA
jgi:P-loop Domain of unknown function (DUF2791)